MQSYLVYYCSNRPGHLVNSHSANSNLANSHLANSHLANSHLTNSRLANCNLADSHLTDTTTWLVSRKPCQDLRLTASQIRLGYVGNILSDEMTIDEMMRSLLFHADRRLAGES